MKKRLADRPASFQTPWAIVAGEAVRSVHFSGVRAYPFAPIPSPFSPYTFDLQTAIHMVEIGVHFVGLDVGFDQRYVYRRTVALREDRGEKAPQSISTDRNRDFFLGNRRSTCTSRTRSHTRLQRLGSVRCYIRKSTDWHYPAAEFLPPPTACRRAWHATRNKGLCRSYRSGWFCCLCKYGNQANCHIAQVFGSEFAER